MKLRRLRLNRLPGLAHAVEITDLADGMNFVFGPNGSGKSSLIRGLRALLDPQVTDPLGVRLEADFVHQGQTVRVLREGGTVQWQQINEQGVSRATTPPTLPAQGFAASVITIDDLLGMERGGERELADLLLREINQGFDLRPLRDAQFKTIRLSAKHRNALHEKRDALNQRLNARRSVSEQRHHLAQLNEQIETAKGAERQRRGLASALALLTAEHERRALQQQLATLPPGMAQLTGREPDEHKDLMQRLAELSAQAREAAHKQTEAEAELAATGLAEAHPQDGDLEARRDALTALGIQRDELNKARQEVAAAEAAWQQHSRARSDLEGDDTPLPDMTADDIEAVERLADQFEPLRHAGVSRPDAASWPRWSWAIGGVGVVAAVAGVVMGQWWINVGGIALIALAWWLPLWQRHRAPTAAVSAPSTVPQALLDERDQLAKRLRLDLAAMGSTAWSMRQFVQHLRDAKAAEAEWRKAQARSGALQQHIDEGVQALIDWLATWQEVAEGWSDLKPALDRLKARMEAVDRLQRQIDDQQKTQQRLATEIEALKKSHQVLLKRLGLREDEIGLLPQRMKQLEQWRGWQRELELQSLNAAQHRAELSGQTTLLALVEADDETALADQLAQAEQQAKALADLLQQSATLTAELAAAERSDDLQTATLAYDQQLAQVRDLRDQAVLHAAGRWWVDDIDQAYRNDQPLPLLAEAQRLFGRFTHNQWTLSFDEGNETFTARDQLQQVDRGLTELSTATRMQLLMALRLARLHTAEAGVVSLPVWVDEALATSDASRLQAVLEALADEITDQGRQVIVLSATDHEQQMWTHFNAQQPAHSQWLPHPAQGSAARGESALTLTLPESVPSPAEFDHDAAAYAQALAVPAIDLTQSFGAMPLFYLLMDDLNLLHGLLNDWRIHAVGPLQAWLASPAASSHQAEADVLGHRLHLAELWWAAVQQGRPRLLTESLLVDSGAVSETMFPPVWELVVATHHDGRALIEGLRDRKVPRFQEARIDQLEAYLREHDAILDEQPLSAEQRLQQVLMHCADAARPWAMGVVASLEQGLGDDAA